VDTAVACTVLDGLRQYTPTFRPQQAQTMQVRSSHRLPRNNNTSLHTKVLWLGTRSPTLEQHQQVRDADAAIGADIDCVHLLIPQQEDEGEIRSNDHLVIAGDIGIAVHIAVAVGGLFNCVEVEARKASIKPSARHCEADIMPAVLCNCDNKAAMGPLC
jgi:hypothetical protein